MQTKRSRTQTQKLFTERGSVKKDNGRSPIEQILGDALRQRLGRRRFTREYVFHGRRQWRFDIAFVKQKLAVEIEGRQHGRAAQHRKDCEKFNAAAAIGWTVLRYPAASVLAKSRRERVVDQIERVLCGVVDADADAYVLSVEK